ncbi:MAG: hypothetical protein KGL90_13280 [Burkholderiales bacterium]|nr:hypothetical protein [Burkholderiales bacterium]
MSIETLGATRALEGSFTLHIGPDDRDLSIAEAAIVHLSASAGKAMMSPTEEWTTCG